MTERRTLRWWLPGLLGLVVLLTGGAMLAQLGWGPGHAGGAGTPTREVRLVCTGHVDVEGGVVSLRTTRPGRVMRVLVQETQQVQAGQPLVLLDDAAAQARLRQVEQELKSAEAKLAQVRRLPQEHAADLALQRSAIEAAQARLAAAGQLLQRQRNLHKINQAADEEVQIAADRVREAEASVRTEQDRLAKLQLLDVNGVIAQAEAEAGSRRAQVAEARHALTECTLQAPSAGEVLRVLTAAGDLLLPEPNQTALLFCPAGPRIIRAEVPQEFATQVNVGQSALIQDDARPGQTWSGRVSRLSNWFAQRRSILQEPLQRNDERTLECLITLEPAERPLRIGQRVRLTIQEQ